MKGGGGGSDATPAGEASSPTGAPGSNHPTGDSLLPSFLLPSFLPPGGNPLLLRSLPRWSSSGREVLLANPGAARGKGLSPLLGESHH